MSKKGSQKYLLALIFLFILLCTAQDVFCSGFAIYTQGASSLGQGAATIAHTEDPSAIFFNPALINKLDGIQILLGTTLIFPSRKCRSNFSGDTFKTEHDVFYPSTLFITNKLSDKLSAGVGVFTPFGLGTEWPDDWEGRYITTNAEMRTYNINPVISYQIRPWITFAVGFDYLLLDATLENKINQSAIFAPDGHQKFEGEGKGIGYNFGILIELHKNISFGASYRSEIEVDIDGKATHDDINTALSPFFPNTDGETEITLPQQVHAGIFYRGLNPFTFGVGLRWEGWSSYDRLKIVLDRPVGIPGTTTSITEKDWEDTYSGNIGVKYQLNDAIALLAGYLYSGNPVPDKTFEPSIPDANTHLFTIGTDVKYKAFRFALAYGYQKLQDRDKNNDITDPAAKLIGNPILMDQLSANGTYKSYLHMVGFSLTYTF